MNQSTSIVSALACLALAGAVTRVSAADTARPAAASAELIVPIAESDIFAEIDANKPFRQVRGGNVGLECAGAKDISVASLDDANGFFDSARPTDKRFGKVADPQDASKKVLMFAPSVGDSLAGAGAKRCELSWWITQPGVVKPYIDIWHAFGLLMPDGGYDFQAVISQYHQLTPQTVNPWAAIQAEKNGLVLFVRHNTTAPPTRATNQTRSFESRGIPTKTWTVIVTKVRIDPNEGGRGYFQAWRDGVQFANYAGPTGYATIDKYPTWQKFGFYPWDHTNWKTPNAVRVLFKAPVFVKDPSGSKYTEASLRAYVLAR